MKSKIVSLLVLASLLFPVVSSALPVPPFVSLTIIVTTEQDANFYYHLVRNSDWTFNIQTQNLQGSKSTYLYIDWADLGASYSLSQDIIPGLNIDSVLCVSTKPGTTFSYYPDGVIFTPVGYEDIVCTFNNVKAPIKTPVLIVPGLLGTEMFKDSEKLWVDASRMLLDIGDEFMDPLRFNEDLSPTDPGLAVTSVLGSPAFGYHFYDLLINEFIGQDYAENETLFTFPYDWRYGVSGVYGDGKTNVDLLEKKIDDILQQTGADRVDVVAHSMGGLIVKKYAMDNPTDNHIGKAVFVGVPNTGAPKALKVLLQGDNFNILGLSDSEIKKISQNMPSAYDLLPTQQYYNIKGSYITKIFVPEATDQIPPPQGILQDLNYQETKSFLVDDHNLNSLGISESEILHSQSFDDYDLRIAGVDLYAIDGCRTGTMTNFVEVKYKDIFGNEHIRYDKIKFDIGDGTVPLESSTNLPIDQNNKYYALFADHAKMPSQNGIRQQIVNIISGSDLAIGTAYGQPLVTQDIAKCKLNGKAIEVFSPVDISAADQDGNRLGLAEDGSILNEIPNADFEIWGEHKFVYLPTDENQTYSINLSGTDTGLYTIKVADIQNSQTIKTEVFSNLPASPNLIGQIHLSYSGNQPTTLVLDIDGDGTTDQSVEPSAVLTQEQSDDLMPPVSTATITGEQGNPGFYKTNVSASISSTDNNSGVLAINYKIDSNEWQKVAPPAGGAAEFAITSEGEHAITYFATDKAGNNEPQKIVSFTIDATPPEAVIEFDPSSKRLKFTGIDNISTKDQIIIQDQGDKIAFKDEAGNVTKLILPAQGDSNVLYPEQNTSNQINFRIKRVRYNGDIINDTRIDMDFSWTIRRNQSIKTLVQDFEIVSKTCPQTCETISTTITANYDGTQTKVAITSAAGKSSQNFSGLKVIKITTNHGNFEWGY